MAKTAIITGSSRGIGAAIALRLAKDGYNIALNDLNDSMFENNDITEKCRAFGVETEIFCADVSKHDECEKLVKSVKERFGSIDVLVNNAGITRDGLMTIMPEEQYDLVIAVNQKSIFNMMKLAGKL
jgi:3-oxoacyl-[acyl-carrier protein] reductase